MGLAPLFGVWLKRITLYDTMGLRYMNNEKYLNEPGNWLFNLKTVLRGTFSYIYIKG